MPVHVIIKRKLQIHKPEQLLPLLTELRNRAKQQPGYISGETLQSRENPGEFMVIATWETAEDWTQWLQSKERRQLQGEVDSLIGERTFYEVFEPISH